MPVAYAKPIDCLDIISSLTEIKDNSVELEGHLHQSLLDASRLIESELFAPEDYFAQAGEDFFERTFYPNGTDFIRLAPFVELQDIKDIDENIIDVDEYTIHTADVYRPTGYYLRWNWRICGRNGWNYYQKIKVTARWGFLCVPNDIKVAVKHMGCLMFLVNANARLGNNNDNVSTEQETRLRNTYNRILAVWRDRFYHNNLGVS